MEADEEYESLAAYLEFLIEAAAPATPVLKFNRVDFRLPWLKARFPDARVIHVWRNSRDQWYSTVRAEPRERWGDPMLETTYELLTWSCALAPEFPFLFSPAVKSSYHRHYLLWRMSKAAGERHSDISVAFTNDMLAAPAQDHSGDGGRCRRGRRPGGALPGSSSRRRRADGGSSPRSRGSSRPRPSATPFWRSLASSTASAQSRFARYAPGISAAWDRLSGNCAREAMDCAMALFSRSRAQAMRNSIREPPAVPGAAGTARNGLAAASATEAPIR